MTPHRINSSRTNSFTQWSPEIEQEKDSNPKTWLETLDQAMPEAGHPWDVPFHKVIDSSFSNPV